MSQPTSYTVGNVTAPVFRSNMNNVLEGLVTLSSGASEPGDIYANMLWYDTAANILKMRSEADDAWINVGYLCQSTNKFCILDDTNVVTTSGTQAGLLGDQATSAWEAGTSTTESLVSPAKVAAAIQELAPDPVGVGQTWQDVSASRTRNTAYRNTTGRAIQVLVRGSSGGTMQVSSNGSTWVTLGGLGVPGAFESEYNPVIPDQHYYRVNGGGFEPSSWVELR